MAATATTEAKNRRTSRFLIGFVVFGVVVIVIIFAVYRWISQRYTVWQLVDKVFTPRSWRTIATPLQLVLNGPSPLSLSLSSPLSLSFKFVCTSPEIAVVENLLSDAECAHIIELSKSRLARSHVLNDTGSADDTSLSHDRTSSTTNLKKSEDAIITAIERRVAVMCALPLENMEPLQVVRYRVGELYKPHYDWFDPKRRGSAAAMRRGGQRTVTVFAYLNTPDDATHCVTVFPNLNVRIEPRKGSAAVWHNLNRDGSGNTQTLHGGEPPVLKDSVKYGLNCWFRERPFV